MKTSSRINKYFQQQTEKLLLLLSKPLDALSANDFHLIRVTIKKIKAILTLLEATRPKFRQKKYYAPFKVVFRLAGKIRDLQVQLMLLRTNPWNPRIDKFEHELTLQTTAEKMKLFNLIQPSLIQEIQTKASTITDYLENLRENKADQFLLKIEKTIQKLLRSSKLKSSRIHELRKRIKDFYYLQKMMKVKKKLLTDTDQFQELLGKWHDGRVLLQGLKTFMKSENLSREDIFSFEALHHKVSADNQQLYQIILHDKNDLLKRLP